VKRNKGGAPKVTLVDKANAIRAQAIWTRVFAEVASEYPNVETDHAYIDAACMWMVKNPEWFDVAVVDNIAEGRSPRKHLPFLRIDGSFTAVGEDGRIAIDPRSYRRYDSFAGAVDALDAEGAALLYGDLRPLFQEAYRDLGYPDRSFDETLARAIHRLLGVPVLEGDVLLRKGERVYYFEDPALEGLSPAEKHLLRMGPAHTTLIQGTLRRLEAALGLDAPGP